MEKNQFAMKFIDEWCEKRSQYPEFESTSRYYKDYGVAVKSLVNSGATILQLEQAKKAGVGAYKNEFGPARCRRDSFKALFKVAIDALKYQQIEQKKKSRSPQSPSFFRRVFCR